MLTIQVRMRKHPHVIPQPTTTPTLLSAIASLIDRCIEQYTAASLNRGNFAAVCSREDN